MDGTMVMEPPGAAGNVASLAERARAGEEGAFSEIVGLHTGTVLRVATRVLGSPDEAEDAAQEVFLRLHRSVSRIDPGRSVEPWLVRVTVNVCRNLRRGRRRRREEPLGAELVETYGSSGRQEERAHAAERARAVMVALQGLTPREREVLVLRDLEGMEVGDVARATGARPGTVRSHLSRARLKIRGALTREGGDGHAV